MLAAMSRENPGTVKRMRRSVRRARKSVMRALLGAPVVPTPLDAAIAATETGFVGPRDPGDDRDLVARIVRAYAAATDRFGGHGESIRLHDVCEAHGIPVWHGGMLESGIGRAHNIHLASLPNFSLPGDIAASRRYFVPDLIEPPIEVSPDGMVAVPTGPGIGVNVDWDRVQAATLETLDI